MPPAPYLLAIDQGTTSSRAIVFDTQGSPIATAQQKITQHYPQDGWVEQDAEEIWRTTLQVTQEIIQLSSIDIFSIAAIGIANQRETTVIWERATGRPIAPAIVWQDRRTNARCKSLSASARTLITASTGLIADPYFSATKLEWLLDNIPEARQRAHNDELAFGTIDSFLIWHFTGSKIHATDATNASRTLLFNIHTQEWDNTLLSLFNIPSALLPEVKDSADDFGHTEKSLLGISVPIRGVAGDQQAATVGQACFSPGMIKSTYGTGCFLLLNTGTEVYESKNRLLSTVAYRLNRQTTYAIEGSIFIAGAVMQWLHEELGIIANVQESETLAQTIDTTGGTYLVPAFTGLGAPYWDAEARGALIGLTRNTGVAQITRAALESVCFQTRDLLEAMQADGILSPRTLRVDGGMAKNHWLLQCLSDQLSLPVECTTTTETTALGVAYLAGLQSGIYVSLEEIASQWQSHRRFTPCLPEAIREQHYAGWLQAVKRVRTRTDDGAF